MKKQDYLKALSKVTPAIEGLNKMTVPQLKAEYVKVTKPKLTPAEQLEKANKLAETVSGKDYDDAITAQGNSEKAMAEMTRKLMAPAFTAITLMLSDDVIKEALKAPKRVAEKIADLHKGNKDVKNAHMSKFRTNLDRAIAAFNTSAKEAGMPEIDKRVAVKAVNNTQGLKYDVSFKARNKPNPDDNKPKGDVIELAIPAGVSSRDKRIAILKGLQTQLGTGKNTLFSDADGNPLELLTIAELLLDAVTE